MSVKSIRSSLSSGDEGPKSPAAKSPVRSPAAQQPVAKRRKLAPLSPVRTANKKSQPQNNTTQPAVSVLPR